jgi:hypothetical protein
VTERPIPLFVPPEGGDHAAPTQIPIPPLPTRYEHVTLQLGIATVNADGRVREKKLIVDDLGWNIGDHTSTRVVPDGILIHRTSAGGDRIDPRHQILIPAGPRALYEIAAGTRVVLVAIPERELLVAHPTRFVAMLLSKYYARRGDLDGC